MPFARQESAFSKAWAGTVETTVVRKSVLAANTEAYANTVGF